jgi:hypothetical protein
MLSLPVGMLTCLLLKKGISSEKHAYTQTSVEIIENSISISYVIFTQIKLPEVFSAQKQAECFPYRIRIAGKNNDA